MGMARFTLVGDACVRIEYAPEGAKFVDAPSLTAVRRIGEPVVVEDRAGVEPVRLETSRLTLTFRPGGAGLNAESLRVEVRGPFAPGGPASASVVWSPGVGQRGNLGGTLSTLDGLKRAAPLPDGLLSRDGWFLIDDSRGHLLVDGWVKAREQAVGCGGTDWYLLCYGAEYGAAMEAFTAFAGRVPMPRRYLLGS
ncbi:MAG: hypothetical protein ACK4WH_15315, partial [Phycisphaerales bacterium]